MKSEVYRNKFIDINNDWIIRNLEGIIELEQFEKTVSEGRKVEIPHIKRIYQDSINYEGLLSHLDNKREIIQKELVLMPYNQVSIIYNNLIRITTT